MQDCLTLEHTVENAQDVLRQLKQSTTAFTSQLSEILERVAQSPKRLPDGSLDWLATFEELVLQGQTAEQTKRAKEQVATRLREEENELDVCQAELTAAHNEIVKLLSQASCQSVDEFFTKNRIYHERLELLARRDTLEANLKVVAGHKPLDQFLRGFATESRASQEKKREELLVQIAATNAQEDSLRQQVASIEAKLTSLSQSQELAMKLQEREVLSASIKSQARDWAKYALAYALLQQTRQDFEQERQPEVLRQASEIFQHITGGAWQSIVISLDKNRTLRMLPKNGQELLAPEALSRGTQEQAYLALRLAYIVSHASFAESLPLLMDEVLVNFDRKRALATAKELARMSQGGFGKEHQIFYFTCHPEIVELFQSEDTKAALFTINQGQIRPTQL